MKVGVLGGTFDPVHNGHLALARAALEQLALGEVVFMPAGQPWRKAGREIAADEDRLAMLRLATAGEPRFSVSTRELERAGPTYTADTLEEMHRERPDDELFFIVGEDALLDMRHWVRPERILELAGLAFAQRGERPKGSPPLAMALPEPHREVVSLKMEPVDVSASEVRERIRGGESIDGMVPPAVARYIGERGLYRT